MEKLKERKKFPSFWISPEVHCFDPNPIPPTEKPKHCRSNSGKLSPYQDHSSLSKLKSALKFVTRKQSPNNSTKIKKNLKKTISLKISKPGVLLPPKIKTKKQKNTKKPAKKKTNTGKLVVLDKQNCKKAPKIYENQIFCDIYDRHGNHDRVMETFEVSQSVGKVEDEFVTIEAKFVIASNLETEQGEFEKVEFRQPDNSLLIETEKDIRKNHFELFAKLNVLAKEQEEFE
jgi:hypothetical protein